MNRKIGRAMHDYSMLADGDKVLVGVSGGEDSLALAWILAHWQKKAPITYQCIAVHVDMSGEESNPGPQASQVQEIMAYMQIPVVTVPALWRPERKELEAGREGQATKSICFQCARSRRTQMFQYAREEGFNKLALGHHRDDIIETFFLNLTCAGNVSTMRPEQELFGGRLSVIRPLAYCDKQEITSFVKKLGIHPVASDCPLSEETRRKDIHNLVQTIYQTIPGAREHIFAALGNVREEYLLKPSSKRQ